MLYYYTKKTFDYNKYMYSQATAIQNDYKSLSYSSAILTAAGAYV